MKTKLNIFWFRRDLRLNDNVGLFKALTAGQKVLPIFIFDTEILAKLPKDDARLTFIHATLLAINRDLKEKHNTGIALFKGKPEDIFKTLIDDYDINTVFTNHDYEPYATERDDNIKSLLEHHAIGFKTFKDQVVFEKNDIVKKDGSPYKVYTPYMKTWKAKYRTLEIATSNSEDYLTNLFKHSQQLTFSLNDLEFTHSNQPIKPYTVTPSLIQNYEATRNFPALDTTSRLGPHLRFGTVSAREMVKKAIAEDNEIFWQELIWREFFMQILWHYPHTKDQAFKPKYDRIKWRYNDIEFKAWCDGKTGYPLVDAGMRELNTTGFMHNRVRMLVGSFLCKHLLHDWRLGEAYFAEKLHDYDMASNIGNWQWVAGCGVDAAPYFRIFNPTTQIQKFDKDLTYIKKWVPEFQELTYAQPVVDHKFARERCLKTYKEALN